MQKIFSNSIIDGCLSMMLENEMIAPKIQAFLEDMPIEFYEMAKEIAKKIDDESLILDEDIEAVFETPSFTWTVIYDDDFQIIKTDVNDFANSTELIVYDLDGILEEILEIEDKDDYAAFANYSETIETERINEEAVLANEEEFEFTARKGKFGGYNVVIHTEIPNALFKNLTRKDLKYSINLEDHFSKEEINKAKEIIDMEL